MILKTNSNSNTQETKTLVDIGNLVFFKKFVFLDLLEGRHLGFDELQKIHTIASQYYQEKAFGYIINREVSFSVNPMSYSILNIDEQVTRIAFIKKYPNSHDLAVEKHFVKKPIEVFLDFEDAAKWF